MAARVELDVAELEVAAAGLARLGATGAAPGRVAAVESRTCARGVALEALARDRALARPAPRAVARVARRAVVDAERALGDAARVGGQWQPDVGGAGRRLVLGLAEGRPVHRRRERRTPRRVHRRHGRGLGRGHLAGGARRRRRTRRVTGRRGRGLAGALRALDATRRVVQDAGRGGKRASVMSTQHGCPPAPSQPAWSGAIRALYCSR